MKHDHQVPGCMRPGNMFFCCIFAALLLSIPIGSVLAQGVAINTTGAPADTSAMLDVSSVTKGMLIPRMTQAQRLAIPLPATGLLMYQTDGLAGLYFNAGSPGAPEWFVCGDPDYNTAVGIRALEFVSTGIENTATGYQAGQHITTSWSNSAYGYQALMSNTTGNYNTALGQNSLFSNTTISFLTAVGDSALYANTTGNQNTAVGYASLAANTSGGGNTATGNYALTKNTTGFLNTAHGFGAMQYNTSGYFNTAVGDCTMAVNTTGRYNSAVGVSALLWNGAASYNSAMGYQALYSNQGDQNTAHGAYSLFTNGAGTRNTAVGTDALRSNIGGYNNTATGDSALNKNVNGNYNTGSGYGTLAGNVSGSQLTAIGSGADVGAGGLTNATAIGYGAVVTGSNSIQLGNSSITMLSCQVGLTFPSDSTKKENRRGVDGEDVLEKIRSMSIGSWNFKGQDPGRFRHYGPMAQEFFQNFGDDGLGAVGNDTSICSTDLDGITLIAIQALEKRTSEIERMWAELSSLRAENAQLKKAYDEMRSDQEITLKKIIRIQALLESLEAVGGRGVLTSQNDTK